jgi:TonB-linked SusC/RagA family outer membrane protein
VPVLLTDWQNEYGMGGNGDLIKSVIKPDFRAKWKIDPAIDSAYFTQDWTSYGSWGPKMDGQMDVMNWYGQMSKFNPQPDNVKDFYQTGNTYTNSVAIEGGNDKATFRLSYTNLENKGIVPTNRLGRNTINFRGTNKFTDQLEADFKVTYVRQENKNRTGVSNSSTNPAMVFVRMPRNVEMSKLKEYYLAPDGSEANWYMEGTNENPYWGVYKNGNKDFRDRITSNVSLLYKPLEWLSLKVNTGTDFYNEKRDLWVATNSLSTTYKDGRYREMTINVKENNSEFLFMINKNFLDDFDFSLNLGGNRMYQYSFTNSSEVIGFAVPDFYSLNNIKDKLNRFESTYKSEKRVNALYASGQFAYKNYLFLDFTARNDWSSTLPKGSNSYFYPSVSLSYAITDALKLNSKYLTFGKIRLAWAKVGNDTEPYRLSPVYSMGEPYGSQPTNVLPLTLPLANLKPESTVSIEVGGDFRFFDNRLGLDLSLYKKNTSNQILDSKISKATGYDAAWINAGEIENKGIEILLNLTTFKTTDWRWDMTINWSKNISKVISLAEGMDSYQIAYNSQATIEARPGEPYGNIVGKAIARWYNYTDSTQTTIADHPGNGKKWVSPEGLYNVGKTEVIGNITPDWIGGISNTISYKNISFSFAIGMQQGGDILSWTNKYLIDQGQTKETLEGRESWYNGTEEQRIAGTVGYVADGVTDKGDVNTKGIDPQKYFHESYKYNGIAETCVYDISYIKLREMILAYTLPKSLLSKTPFSKASISFVGRNLWLIKSNIPNIDPESTFSSENSALGQEWGSLPPSRNWGFNLSLSF